MINKQNVKDIYPLSPMQESMLFQSLIDPESSAYFEQTSFLIDGTFDRGIFEKSIRFLFQKYDILRSVFIHKNVSRPFQVVLKEVTPDIIWKDISDYSEENKEEYIEDLKVSDKRKSFDLSGDVLMRIHVLSLGNNKFQVLWSHHHILMDGWCMGIIIQDFLEAYENLKAGEEPSQKSTVPYSQYIKWIEQQNKQKTKDFWKGYLQEVEELTTPNVSGKQAATYQKNILNHTFNKDKTDQINQTCKELGITPNTFFQVAWGVVLSRINYNDTAVFGSVVSGRPAEIPGVESILGLFINTIPFKVSIGNGDITFIDLLKETQQASGSLLGKEYLPLADIQNESSLGNNLFDHILVYENYPSAAEGEKIDKDKYGFSIQDIEVFEQTNYDLNIIFLPRNGETKVKFDFNANVYSNLQIQQLLNAFVQVVELCLEKPNTRINDCQVGDTASITLADEHKIHRTVIDQFLLMCRRNPDNIAIRSGEESLSYRLLDQRSNDLATYLWEENNIKEGDVVGIYVSRSPEALISILAILKLGATYVPIDKTNPEGRVNYILGNAQADLLITDEERASDIPVLNIGSFEFTGTGKPINNAKLDSRAYIIYTSGSTGNPKGCQLTHRNLSNYISWASDFYTSKPEVEGNTALYTSLSFDLTITSLFVPLVKGASISIFDKELSVEQTLEAIFKNEQIDLIKITPAHITLLPHLNVSSTGIGAAIVGGEELKPNHVEILKRLNSEITIYNEYGPTETTVGCSVKTINKVSDDISIGVPVANTALVVMDKGLNPVIQGGIGELCVVGEGVGLGYYGMEQLTADKFVDLEGKKLYRTGDLGVVLEHGEFQFLGRFDDQVKIRGYRIELGEIEKALQKESGISNAFVTDINKDSLVGFVETSDIDIELLKKNLRATLPDYMVPEQLIKVDRIPLTANGKIDKRKLLDLVEEVQEEFEAPKGEVENKLASIWKEVLGKDQIGRSAHFFRLGGHSLKTTILSSLIQKEFKKEVSVKQLFETPVLSDQAVLISSNKDQDILEIPSAKKAEYYPVSFAQKRLYILHQLDDSGTAYNIPSVLQFKGDFDVNRFKKCLEMLTQRHETLRTSFHMFSNEPVQKIHDSVEIDFSFDHNEREVDLEEVQRFIQPFELSAPKLFRCKVFKNGAHSYIVCLDFHHIISDGVSVEVLIEELTSLYKEQQLPEVKIHYKDFAVWQQEFIKSEKYQKQKEYWLRNYQQLPEPLMLPYSRPRPEEQTYNGATINLSLKPEVENGIKDLVEKSGLSNFMFLLSAFNVLLHKYSGQNDFVVGTPVSGRTIPDIQKSLGVFINTLPLRTHIISDFSFEEYTEKVRDNVLSGLENQDYPFEELVEQLSVPSDLSRNPLFDVMFIVQNTNNDVPQIPGLDILPYSFENKTSKFDLTMEVMEYKNGLSFNLEYNTDLFTSQFIENLFTHFEQVLQRVIKSPSTKIKEIELLTPSEKQELLSTKTGEEGEFDNKSTLITRFLSQTQKDGEKVAVSVGEESYTYKELNESSNALAKILQEHGVGTGDIVGIQQQRTAGYIISMLGIMKAGAVYVPIDPNYPEDRQEYIIRDSKAKLVLTDQDSNTDDVYMNISNLDFAGGVKDINLSSPEALAYIIYTSGSTGNPKGVAIEHRNAVSMVDWAEKEFQEDQYEVVFAGTSFSFDLSVFEIFFHLSAGKRIRLLESGLEINDYLKKEEKILLNTVPSVINDLQNLNADFSRVVSINMAGEPIPYKVKERLDLNEIHVRNLYGPSEDTTYSTGYYVDQLDQRQIIGKPIDGTKAYVLDANIQLVPKGVAGELYLSGTGITRGYLYKEDLTNERFLQNPFKKGQRLYKTGDLVKWNEDWNLEYLGRIDNQVKIRGHRIELGEIESALEKEKIVREACVIARDIHGEKQLCAYLGADNKVDVAELKSTLTEKLPSYMVPGYFTVLDKLPLTPNGKIDKKALPEPQVGEMSSSKTLPKTEEQHKLASLWEEVLNLEQVYLEDNFFDLGGHSLKATVLASRIEQQFRNEFSIREVFKYPVLEDQLVQIRKGKAVSSIALTKAPYKKHYAVSSAQKRIYVLHNLEPENIQYNMTYTLEITGDIDVQKVENAFQEIIDRHEVLRTNFKMVDNEAVQVIHPSSEFKLEQEEIESWKNELVDDIVKPFDLEQDCLLRAKLYQTKNNKCYLLIDIHHIIFDGYSIGNFIEEFGTIYGGDDELQPLHIQYKDFSEWQTEYFKSEKLQEQKQFWLDAFEEIPENLDLPTDYKRPKIQSYKGNEKVFSLGEKLSGRLEQVAKTQETTLFNVLLAAFYLVLHKYSGKKDMVVGTPVSGRTRGEIKELIGLFINTLGLRNTIQEESVAELIDRVHEANLKAFENQDYPLEDLIENLNLQRDLSRSPLFEVMFAYENTDNANIEVDGLGIDFLDTGNTTSKFDLTLVAIPNEGNFDFRVEYCTDLFTEAYIEQFFNHYQRIVETICANSNTRISDIELLSMDQEEELLKSSNKYQPADKTEHFIARWNDNLKTYGDKNAGFDGSAYTFNELNERSNQIAFKVPSTSRIGVLLAPGLDFVATVLAIWKQGGTYVPLDINAPQSRLDFILKDAQISTVVGSAEIVQNYTFDKSVKCLIVEETNESNGHIPDVKLSPDDEAYVIYTSGSTGQPKGVSIAHHQLVRKLDEIIDLYDLQKGISMLRVTNHTFDVSLLEIFMPLLAGGKTIFPENNRILEHEYLMELCEDHQVTDLQCTPSFLEAFMEVNKQKLPDSSINNICVGGESMTSGLVKRVKKYVPNAQLNNHYGPTETTIDSIIEVNVSDFERNVIGAPMKDNFIVICDEYGHALPKGLIGEICIGGSSVSKGYLNREEETKKAFTSYSWKGEKVPLYKTGDLGKWNWDGKIEFYGRKDDQVKIRGYRIELGEVEAQLNKIEGVKQSVVTVISENGAGSKALCAHVVAELETSEIKNRLAGQVPSYMVPGYMMTLEELPLTKNGKVDKKALPKPSIDSGKAIRSPQNAKQNILVDIFSQVLAVEQLSIDDDFFELGGDSIKAIQVSSRFKNKGYKVEVKDIFENTTVEKLAAVARKTTLEIDQGPVHGKADFTPIIEYFINHSTLDKNHYNQSLVLHASDDFDERLLQQVLQKLVDHHDALRLHVMNNKLVNQDLLEVDLQVVNLTSSENVDNDIEEHCNQLQQSFDIEKGPLFKFALFHTSNKGDFLALIFHHLVIDGVSWRIILEDLQSLYQNIDAILPSKTSSFISWAERLNEYAQKKKVESLKPYWEKTLSTEALFEKRNIQSSAEPGKIVLNDKVSKKLSLDSNKTFNTNTGELLMAALGRTIYQSTGRDEVTIMMESHGREELFKDIDISRTVGWFTSEYPVRVPNLSASFCDLVIESKEAIRSVPDHGISFGLVQYLNRNVKLENNQKPQIIFNYLGDFSSEVKGSESISISSTSSGENQAKSNAPEYVLEVNAYLAEGKITLELAFDPEYINQELAKELTNNLEKNLVQLTEYCEELSGVRTASDFGLRNISHQRFTELIKPFDSGVEKIYPLSPMQLGMLFINLKEEDDAYFEQTIINLKGEVDLEAFENGYNRLIARHEILRSNIVYENLDDPLTIVSKEKFGKIPFEDISGLSKKEQEQYLENFLEEEKNQGFDLASDLLMLISLFKTGPQEYKVVWTHHHILMDGWCLGILLNEFLSIYNGDEEKLGPVTSYSDYIKWIEEQDEQLAEEYWKKLLGDYDAAIELPGYQKQAKEEVPVFEKSSLVLDDALNQKLHEFSRENHFTLYNVIQAVWGIVLQKLNSTNEAVFGSVISGRPAEIEGVEQIVGLFINTIPVKIGREKNVFDTIRSVQKQFNESNEKGYLPLNEISKHTSLGNELINHLMIFENYPLDEKTKELNEGKSSFKLESIDTEEVTNFDFTVTILPTDNLTISFDYNVHVFDKQGIKILESAFHEVLKQVLDAPEVKVSSINLLTKEQEKELLKLNPPETETSFGSFVEMFAHAVATYPENIALKHRNNVLTYQELDERSNQIAHTLISKNIGSGSVVGIFARPCIEMMEGILGILKSGAAYLPIDLKYPQERIEYMLQDAGAKVVLTTEEGVDKYPVDCFDLLANDWKNDNTEQPKVNINSDDTAYIIYTSGSTGNPKGVAISQESFVDYVEFAIGQFAISEKDTMLQHASIAFDTTIEELYPVLGSGGKIVLPADNKDFVEMLDHLASGEITYFCTSPLVLNYINEENKGLGNLRIITVGGDELKPGFIDKIIDKVSIWNGYGPTESTVCAAYYEVNGNEKLMPIGKPFRNRASYVVNHDFNLLPKGIPGQLCIGGKGLAKEYLNQPELTAEKFIDNPFGEGRIYQSGDLVCWNEQNNLNFFGRIDNQIQIRGFRVELGEVENQIDHIGQVQEVAVLALDDDELQVKYLCAYVVGDIDEHEIIHELNKDLPEYMIPSKFIMMDKLPLTANGKIDKKALPKPNLEHSDENIALAENSRQQVLLDTWKEVLKQPNIGIDNNFFGLGGDSIKAIQVASRIQKHELKLDIRDIFTHPTIRELEPYLKELNSVADQGLVSGEYLLTPIQKMFFEEGLDYPNHYNQAVMLYAANKVDKEKIGQAVIKLVEHHDALRTKFVQKDGSIIQQVSESIPEINLEELELDEQEVEAKAQELQASLNIYEGKLMVVALFDTPDGGMHILFAIHHLVVDGISWRVILEDLNAILTGDNLPMKTQSFKSWSERLKEYASGKKLNDELNYWSRALEGNKVAWTDVKENKYSDNKEKGFVLDEEQTKLLLTSVHETYNTEINDLLLAALGENLQVLTNSEENIIFLEGHGREELFEDQDISRTVGWFTSMFPVKLTKEPEPAESIKNIKEYLRKIPNKGVGYGVLRYLNEDPSIQEKLKAVPEITFNYLGQFDNNDQEEEGKQVFGISKLSPGYAVDQRNQKESILDINGIVNDGKLTMEIAFNASVINEGDVDEFLKGYEESLKNLIEHCLSKEEVEKTASDFESGDLSNEELDDIMDMLEDL